MKQSRTASVNKTEERNRLHCLELKCWYAKLHLGFPFRDCINDHEQACKCTSYKTQSRRQIRKKATSSNRHIMNGDVILRALELADMHEERDYTCPGIQG